jgi:hypothetical protein
MCWLLIAGLTLGIIDQDCLGESSEGPVSGSLFTDGDKEKKEWAVMSMWGLLLGPGSIL